MLSKFYKQFPLMFSLIAGSIAASLVYFYVNSPISAASYHEVVSVELNGVLAPNRKLTHGTKIHDLNGPESIAEDDEGNLYTGTADGAIVKIEKSRMETGRGPFQLVSDGIMSKSQTTRQKANPRPLGLRFRKGVLYAMDATYGMYSIDLSSKKVSHLVLPNVTKPQLLFPNDLDITKDGKTAFFTDLSHKFPLSAMAYAIYDGGCFGRLFRYAFDSNEVTEVVDNLCSANGVQLSEDEEIMPDNIRGSKRGTYWIGGSHISSLSGRMFRNLPFLRQLWSGMFTHDQLLKFFLMFHDNQHSIAVEVNDNGSILQTLHDTEGKLVTGLAHVHELSDGRLVLGSFFASHIAIATIS